MKIMINKPWFFISIGILLVFSFTACQTTEKDTNGYVIEATISGLTEGRAILANLDLITNEQVDIDTATIEDNKFSFMGRVNSPYLHTIIINDTAKIHFFLENSNIKITGDINNLDKINISRSREDSLFRSYPMDSIFARKAGMEIMLGHPDYAFAAFTAYYQFQVFNISLDTMSLIIENFSEPVKKTIYYQHLAKLYQTLKRVSISQPAPEFSMHDTNGNLVSLSDFQGKYVLIDFWASWCAPCRAANPDLVKLYNKFNQQAFTILGVSVDKDKNKWLKAVADDGLIWTNVSEANGWNEITDLYGVKAVPQNFLLDPNGIIIEKNISAPNLTALLEDLLNEESQE